VLRRASGRSWPGLSPNWSSRCSSPTSAAKRPAASPPNPS